MDYRSISATPEKMAAARESRKTQFVGAETFRTQGGIWYWYCLEHEQASTGQLRSSLTATSAAISHDQTWHAGRRV